MVPMVGIARLLHLLLLLNLLLAVLAFQSDELQEDDEEWGITGGSPKTEDVTSRPAASSRPARGGPSRDSAFASDSKPVQFELGHSFGSTDFSPAGHFTARLRTSHHGVQSLTKLRLTRNEMTTEEQEAFQEELRKDGFYSIRVPANVLSPSQEYIMSSVKARCLAASDLQEQFDIYMDKGNIIAIGYGAGSCAYPRRLNTPKKWTFSSHVVLKSGEQASRIQANDVFFGEDLGDDGQPKKPPEKSFWAKYWMYLVPLGIIVLNAITQVANMPGEAGQGGSPQGATQRAVTAGSRRR